MEDVAAIPLSRGHKMIVTVLIMLGMIMVVLDTTIANVALPHMQSSLGATSDSISWVLTSYILASAVATPLTGWLAGRMGRKRLFGLSLFGFTISSALCGVAPTLPAMVGARVMQGIFGAFIVPMTQAFMYDVNAKSEQVRALTIWGMGVMVAPILGPVLGGYLTDSFDWRWVFFINVPLGIAAAIGALMFMPEFPSERRSFDMTGFLLMLVTLSGLQLVLDRGTQQDWFTSTEILIESGLFVGGLWMLVLHLRNAAHPILPAGLFQDRNFMAALVFVFVAGAIATAGSALLAPMLQTLLGYPVFDAGLLVMPRGIGMMLTMMIAGRLLTVLDPRIMIVFGMGLVAASLALMTGFNLQMGSRLIIWSGALQGFGLGFVMMPVNLLALSTLPPLMRTEGSAMYSLIRNLGGSVVISVTSALLARNLQINHAELGISLTSAKLPFLMPGLASLSATAASIFAYANAEITRQSMMIAYLDDYWLLMWSTIVVLPIVIIMRPVKAKKGEHIAIGE